MKLGIRSLVGACALVFVLTFSVTTKAGEVYCGIINTGADRYCIPPPPPPSPAMQPSEDSIVEVFLDWLDDLI